MGILITCDKCGFSQVVGGTAEMAPSVLEAKLMFWYLTWDDKNLENLSYCCACVRRGLGIKK